MAWPWGGGISRLGQKRSKKYMSTAGGEING